MTQLKPGAVAELVSSDVHPAVEAVREGSETANQDHFVLSALFKGFMSSTDWMRNMQRRFPVIDSF